MNMVTPATFAVGIVWFTGLVVFQNLLWRTAALLRLSLRREFLVLLTIFVGGSVGGMFLAHDLAPFLLSLSFSVVYVMVFGCASVRSPSLEILRLVHLAEGRGLTKEEIARRLAEPGLLQDRMDDLKRAGLWTAQRSTFAGKCLGAFFYYFRRSLRQAMGTG